MRILFIRHAESTGNAEHRLQGRTEYGLSKLGIWQAERLRDRFVNEKLSPTHVYSSPMIRTAETARIVMEPWPVHQRIDGDLIEADIGDGSGLTEEEFEAKFPRIGKWKAKAGQIALMPGAESLHNCRIRANRVIQRLISKHREQDTVVAFSHGAILAHIVSELLGTKRSWRLSANNTAVFDFYLAIERWGNSGPDINYSTTNWRINRFNDIAHLDKKN